MLGGCIKLFLLLTITGFVSAADDNLVVELPYGKIRGHIKKSYEGKDFYAFQEIPYAAPPVGPNRFKEPINPDPWDGILNTIENKKQCIQEQFSKHPVDSVLEQSEDCLFLNVYTPQKLDSNSSLSVLVFIHGGAYLTGSGAINVFNPSGFIDYNIVIVTLNYRLGVLGFLTTQDGVIPGNLGLKDQVFALQWVKSNIHLFGGDPDKITIAGESAGAFSVGYHLLAPNTTDLFRGAILQSGSSICQAAYAKKPKENAFNFGKSLYPNFNSDKSEDLLELLLNISTTDLVEASKNLEPADGRGSKIKWLPVIENESDQNPLIIKPMHDSFWKGDFHRVPILLGFNSEEYLLFIDDSFDSMGEKFDKDLTLLVSSEFHMDEENATYVGSKIRKIYTNSLFLEDQAAVVKYNTDNIFTNAILRHAELSAQYVATYCYQFSYMGNLGALINPNRYRFKGAEGVAHAEELMYMWDSMSPDTKSDELMMKRFFVMWSNFVKYLNPTPIEEKILENAIWPKVEDSNIQFLNINETLSVQTSPRHYSEWRKLILEYIQPPFTTF